MVNSAFVGEPPATEDDFYIVRGILRTYGLNNLNASAGLVFSIQRPENPPDESKKPAILAGMILVILAIVVPTVARVIIRLKGARTQFGADDLAIIAAAVSKPVHLNQILLTFLVFGRQLSMHCYSDARGNRRRSTYIRKHLRRIQSLFLLPIGMQDHLLRLGRVDQGFDHIVRSSTCG